MSNRKAYNSVLFLTTLGVYLGLMLAGGAAPQVYAHAAMTRNFELVDEIEFKDDLDNKPDDDRSDVNLSVQVYLEDVEQFLFALNRLSQRGEFDLSFDTFDVVQDSSLPCTPSSTAGRFTPVKLTSRNAFVNPFLEKLSKQTNYGYSLADCVVDDQFDGKETSRSKFILKHDGSDLVLQIAVKKSSSQSASALAAALTETFGRFRTSASPLRQAVIDNTKAHSTGDQVFVVTRLPRGSLDPLFAVVAT